MQSLYLCKWLTQFSTVFSKQFYNVGLPVRDVAIYACCAPTIFLPMHDRMQICFLWRINRVRVRHILKLKTAQMRFSQENAVTRRV